MNTLSQRPNQAFFSFSQMYQLKMRKWIFAKLFYEYPFILFYLNGWESMCVWKTDLWRVG